MVPNQGERHRIAEGEDKKDRKENLEWPSNSLILERGIRFEREF